MNRNMTGANVALQLIEHPKAGMVRQADVQDDGAWNEFPGDIERLGRAACDKTFELHLVGKISKDVSETLVVLNSQKDAPLTAQPLSIVFDLPIRPSRRSWRRDRQRRFDSERGRGGSRRRRSRLYIRGAKRFGDDDCERATLAFLASEGERSAKQTDKLPTDRQPETGAAILAADRAVRLPERLEHGVLFVLGDADAGVGDRQRNLAVGGARDSQLHCALFGELECVRQQVPQNLLEPLTVCLDVCWTFRRHFDTKLESFLLGDRREKVREVFSEARESKRLGLDLHVPRLDLREVEDVVDERQQIVAGRLDRLGVTHLLRAQPSGVIVGEELREDQQ